MSAALPAAPTSPEMNNSTNTAEAAAKLFVPMTQSKLHRELRAKNVVDINYRNTSSRARYLVKEDPNFMKMWHTGLGYLDKDEDMKKFMSDPTVSDRVVDIMVVRSCFWWTPCGLILWGSSCFWPDNPCAVPVYYLQRMVVYGCFCPCSTCLTTCLGPLAASLAPQTKITQRQNVQKLQDAWVQATKEAEATLQGKAPDFFTMAASATNLTAPELVLCSRLAIVAYLPTVPHAPKVNYVDFVPLERELNIESRVADDPSALESLLAFCANFYSPSDPDSDGNYGHAKPIGAALKPLGLELVHGFDISSTDTQGFIAKSMGFDNNGGGDVVIAFRGTTSARDWLTNFSGGKVPFNPDRGAAAIGLSHSGFYGAFMSALPIIIKYAEPLINSGKNVRIVIAGHSLGAALSTLCAGYFLKKWGDKAPPAQVSLLCCTFGSPKTCDKELATFIDSKMGPTVRLFRCHNQKDPVPATPPLSMGFVHCCTRVVLTPGGGIFFPADHSAGEEASDSTTSMLLQAGSMGSALLMFHDPFLYSDATFRFQKRCVENGIQV